TPLDNARLIWRNAPLAQQLGVPDALFAPESGAGCLGRRMPDFYTSLSPTPLDNARLIWRNAPLAQQLGVPDALFAPESGAG
ncbi:hypothetical protein C5706_32740, partial [Klebsiella pneumoniae]